MLYHSILTILGLLASVSKCSTPTPLPHQTTSHKTTTTPLSQHQNTLRQEPYPFPSHSHPYSHPPSREPSSFSTSTSSNPPPLQPQKQYHPSNTNMPESTSKPTPTNNKAKPTNLYFAYGSNLSLHQMSLRCPTSPYFAFGVLKGYRWIISKRGYANVVEISGFVSGSGLGETGREEGKFGVEKDAREGDGKVRDEVQGLLYVLSKEDEESLDFAEGVPDSYEKFWLDVEVDSIPGAQGEVGDGSLTDGEEVGREGVQGMRREGKGNETVKALVYVDLKRTESGVCREEYVARINRGVRDASERGMSEEYVNQVIRRWVPGRKLPDDDGDVKDPFGPGT